MNSCREAIYSNPVLPSPLNTEQPMHHVPNTDVLPLQLAPTTLQGQNTSWTVTACSSSMAEASGSGTPPRSRTATSASTGSQSTPARLYRLFTSPARASKAEGSSIATPADDLVRTGSSSSSSHSSLEADGHLEDATPAAEERPSTPTPAARRGSQGGLPAASSSNLTTPQRRNSRGSFLSSILVQGAGPSTSQSTSAAKGDSVLLSTPPHPAAHSLKPGDNASASVPSTWRMPWSSPKKKALQAPATAEPAPQANSFGSVGLTMNGEIEDAEPSPLVPMTSNSSMGDVLDEGISMSDTSGKVGESL